MLSYLIPLLTIFLNSSAIMKLPEKFCPRVVSSLRWLTHIGWIKARRPAHTTTSTNQSSAHSTTWPRRPTQPIPNYQEVSDSLLPTTSHNNQQTKHHTTSKRALHLHSSFSSLIFPFCHFRCFRQYELGRISVGLTRGPCRQPCGGTWERTRTLVVLGDGGEGWLPRHSQVRGAPLCHRPHELWIQVCWFEGISETNHDQFSGNYFPPS